MVRGTPVLVWVYGAAPLLARYVAEATVGGVPAVMVRFATAAGGEGEGVYDRTIVSPMRPELAMALDRGSVLVQQEGRA